jgi:hypothetical protein
MTGVKDSENACFNFSFSKSTKFQIKDNTCLRFLGGIQLKQICSEIACPLNAIIGVRRKKSNTVNAS